MDGDGLPELAAASGIFLAVLSNATERGPRGAWARHVVANATEEDGITTNIEDGFTSVAVADVDGDGDTDAISTSAALDGIDSDGLAMSAGVHRPPRKPVRGSLDHIHFPVERNVGQKYR